MPSTKACLPLSILFIVAFGISAHAGHTVSGRITDSAGRAVGDAVLVAGKTGDSTILQTGFSDRAGYYSLHFNTGESVLSGPPQPGTWIK